MSENKTTTRREFLKQSLFWGGATTLTASGVCRVSLKDEEVLKQNEDPKSEITTKDICNTSGILGGLAVITSLMLDNADKINADNTPDPQ